MRNFMKGTILFILILLTKNSFASLEYSKGQEGIISEKKLSQQHSCFKEISDAGCGHPRENQIFFKACLEEKVELLSPGCQTFFTKLYGRKTQSGN